MTTKRKNNPALLRHRLIICAKDIMLQDGISQLSLQKVADMAGVSKGGLLHHFKSKDELTDGVLQLFIAQLNTAIMAQMTDKVGAFTRAYVWVFFNDTDIGLMSEWAGFIGVMTAEARLYQQWQAWLTHKLSTHANTDSDVRLAVVRHAVDGYWLYGIDDTDKATQIQGYLLRLIDETCQS